MKERLILSEFSPEIVQGLETYADSDEADALATCLARLDDDKDAVMTPEARLAFAKIVDVPETVFEMTPIQARVCFELVDSLREALAHDVSVQDAAVFVLATRDDSNDAREESGNVSSS